MDDHNPHFMRYYSCVWTKIPSLSGSEAKRGGHRVHSHWLETQRWHRLKPPWEVMAKSWKNIMASMRFEGPNRRNDGCSIDKNGKWSSMDILWVYHIWIQWDIRTLCNEATLCFVGLGPWLFFEPQIPSDSVSRVPFRGYTNFGTKDVEWRLRDSLWTLGYPSNKELEHFSIEIMV